MGAANRCARHYVLGMRLDHIQIDQFVRQFVDAAAEGNALYCCVPDVSQCLICYDSDEHRAIVNGADYVISDSTVLQTARALRCGVKPMKTVLGYEMTLKLCAKAEADGVPIALVGGRDDAVLDRIKAGLLERFPGLQIVYAYSPPFRELSPDEEAAMLERIRSSGAQLLFVGLGCPKQERWMGRYHPQIQAALIGVGAAFDTIGGITSPSPQIVHRLGFEWLFRLCKEPRRLYKRYLFSAPRFVYLLTADWLKSRLTSARGT
ncbi:MAG: WecB/TagA/CpsF family glycosyltransferase [Filomicrobium sp.]